MCAQWHNVEEGVGYTVRQLRRHRTWLGIPILPRIQYEFSASVQTPLTWEDEAGFWRVSPWPFVMDMGTVPPPMSIFIPPNLYPASFGFHDDAFRHRGLWWSSQFFGEYEFRPLTLWKSNAMLRCWINAEGGSRLTPVASAVIQAGVAVGAFGIAAREALRKQEAER